MPVPEDHLYPLIFDHLDITDISDITDITDIAGVHVSSELVLSSSSAHVEASIGSIITPPPSSSHSSYADHDYDPSLELSPVLPKLGSPTMIGDPIVEPLAEIHVDENEKAGMSKDTKRDGRTGRFAVKSGTPEQMKRRRQMADRKKFIRNVDSLMEKVTKFGEDHDESEYFLVVKHKNEVHYTGSTNLLDNFKSNNVIMPFNDTMFHANQESIIQRLNKAKILKTAVQPSPTKGPDQMGFLPGQNVRQSQLINLQLLDIQSPPEEEHVSVESMKKRIFTRKKRQLQKPKPVEVEGSNRGRGRGRGRGREEGEGEVEGEVERLTKYPAAVEYQLSMLKAVGIDIVPP